MLSADTAAAIAGLAGVVAIPLPFADEVPPGLALISIYVQLALPVCLAVPISLFLWRWIVTGRLSPRWRRIGYTLAGLGAFAWLSLYVYKFNGLFAIDIRQGPWFFKWQPLVALVVPALLVLGITRRGVPDALRPVLWMQGVYVAAAFMCLFMFQGELNIGAHFVLVALVACLVHVAAIAVQAFRGGR